MYNYIAIYYNMREYKEDYVNENGEQNSTRQKHYLRRENNSNENKI